MELWGPPVTNAANNMLHEQHLENGVVLQWQNVGFLLSLPLITWDLIRKIINIKMKMCIYSFCTLSLFLQHCWAPGDLAGQRDWRLQEIHFWRAGAKWDTNYAAEVVPHGRWHLQKADQSEGGAARGSAGRLQHPPPHSEGDRAHPHQALEGTYTAKCSLHFI